MSRTPLSESHSYKLYLLSITNFSIYISRALSFNFPRTVSSKMSRTPSSESHHHELYHLNITNSWRSVSSISQLYYSNFNGLYHLKCHELYHPNLALTSSIIWISDTLSHLHLNSISSTSHELYLLYQSRTLSPLPVTEEIRLKMFGSPDFPVVLDSLLNDGDSVYSSENLLEILGTPEKTCFICTGTPVKTCWEFWHS